MRISFALVVWGQQYVRDFLSFSLPTLLAQGNLSEEQDFSRSCFYVFTTKADFETLQQCPLFHRLQRIVPTKFVDAAPLLRGPNKYLAASRCQAEALRVSEASDMVFLIYSDTIWCKGAIAYGIGKIASGALALFSPGVTVLPELATAELYADPQSISDTPDGPIVSARPNTLAGIAIRHHHPMWDDFDWDADCTSESPSCFRWNVAPNAWLVRCFHLHPVVMRVQANNPKYFCDFGRSLDGEFVARLFSGTDGLAFASDTDDFALLTLHPKDAAPFQRPHRTTTVDVARWAEGNAFLTHRAFSKVAVRWHDGPVGAADWRTAEARSQTIISEVLDRLQTPDSVIRAEDPTAYRIRMKRRYSKDIGRRPRMNLPPSVAEKSRLDLLRIAIRNLLWSLAMGLGKRVDVGPIGKWLRGRKEAIRLWKHIKSEANPQSSVYASLTIADLLRSSLKSDRKMHAPGNASVDH